MSFAATVTDLLGEKMSTFSQKPKANPCSQSERCPGQNNLFDFSFEEPAADTQNIIKALSIFPRQRRKPRKFNVNRETKVK